MAGTLGSDQKEQYDIFGTVVNQTARIEGITKLIKVPILVTEAVARHVSAERILSRRVARFRPAGMDETIDLYTIICTPPEEEARQRLEERFAKHARGLEAFEAGRWEEAFQLLAPIATEDPAARYLLLLAGQGKSPEDWAGVIKLDAK